jgi:4-nitrophenyl phosphatase
MADARPPVLCDLDGVVWLAQQPIPGSAEAIGRLRAAGHRVVFVTNNSTATVATTEDALARIGIPARGDVITSAWAAATLVEPGSRVLVVGEQGLVEAMEARGARVVDGAVPRGEHPDEAPEVVVVGMCRHFDYPLLARASAAVRAGAVLLGSNDDATYPTPDGEVPGGGSILAAISTAAGVTPVIAGKPHPPMAELVRTVLGQAHLDQAWMVGDRPSTDGAFAAELGCRFALVRSGVTPPGARVEPPPDLDAADLAALADAITG